MSRATGCLLVLAGGRRLGLPLEAVIEVLPPCPLEAVPSVQPALLGVINQRGQLVPVFDLGRLVGEAAMLGPARDGGALILADLGGRRVALLVEEAEVVVSRGVTLLRSDDSLPWARAIVALPDDGYVPLLDFAALGSRLAESGT